MRYRLLAMMACLIPLLGCMSSSEETPTPPSNPVVVAEKKADPPPEAETKKLSLWKNITLEVQGTKRRVRVNSEVCLREGFLEQLLTRKGMKEHEAILSADIDARHLHAALTLAGAEPGKPVQFRPKLVAPTGTPIKVFLEYTDKNDNKVRIPAQEWILNKKSKKDLHTDWVFAGSFLDPNPNPKGDPFYRANDGDIITVVNFEGACIDVPFLNTKDNDDLVYIAHTARIPPEKTPVSVVLEPVIQKKN